MGWWAAIALDTLVGGVALAGPVMVPKNTVNSAQADRLFRGRRLALVVGPSTFEDPGLAALRYTDDDANAVADALSDPKIGGFDRVWRLTSPEDTTGASVRAALAELAAEVRAPEDTVFIYFSTHGTLARAASGGLAQHLVLSDTRLAEIGRTSLPHDELLGWLDALPSRRKVMLLATCHSGQGKSALSDSVAAELASTKGGAPVPMLREVSEAVVLIGVCAWNETARESEALGHDIYTWYFLEALTHGDLDGDGAVTVTEAHDHARRKAWAFSEGTQRAWAQAEVLGQDPIVLSGQRGRASGGAAGSYSPGLDGWRVRVDGTVKGTLPDLVALEPGTHDVALLPPGIDRPVAQRRVRVRAGSRLDVADLLREDKVRVGGGLGGLWMDIPGGGGVLAGSELHLPGWLPGRWELMVRGAATVRWPRPVLTGGLVAERRFGPGAWHLRAGVALDGYLLMSAEAPDFLAPSLVPGPSLAVGWLPNWPIYMRVGGTGGYLWRTHNGAWEHGWVLRSGLVAGIAF